MNTQAKLQPSFRWKAKLTKPPLPLSSLSLHQDWQMCPNSQTDGVPVGLLNYTHAHTWLEPTTVTWLFDLKWE